MNRENDSTDDQPTNPYAAPVSLPVATVPDEQLLLTPPKPGRVVGKWLIVCFVAAGPSFFFGAGIGGWRIPEIAGMIAGILIFVAGYSGIEFLPQIQSAMAQRAKRKSTRIAYITRMGISILFPIGVFIDMYCGIVSLSLSAALTGAEGPMLGGSSSRSEAVLFRFLHFLLTTLIQGTLLNIIVFAYMLVVYGFLHILGIRNSINHGKI